MNGWVLWFTGGVAIVGIVMMAGAIEPQVAAAPHVIEGPISLLNLAPPEPRVGVVASDGQVVMTTVDLQDTAVLIGGRKMSADQLVPGQWIKVHYTLKEGQPVATAIVSETPTITFVPAQ